MNNNQTECHTGGICGLSEGRAQWSCLCAVGLVVLRFGGGVRCEVRGGMVIPSPPVAHPRGGARVRTTGSTKWHTAFLAPPPPPPPPRIARSTPL